MTLQKKEVHVQQSRRLLAYEILSHPGATSFSGTLQIKNMEDCIVTFAHPAYNLKSQGAN
jgi:hypothetical protein